MWKISGATLDGTAGGLHVDPEEVAHERLLEVAVDVWVIDDPQQLVDGHDRLTHRLYEPILTLHQHQLASSSSSAAAAAVAAAKLSTSSLFKCPCSQSIS